MPWLLVAHILTNTVLCFCKQSLFQLAPLYHRSLIFSSQGIFFGKYLVTINTLERSLSYQIFLYYYYRFSMKNLFELPYSVALAIIIFDSVFLKSSYLKSSFRRLFNTIVGLLKRKYAFVCFLRKYLSMFVRALPNTCQLCKCLNFKFIINYFKLFNYKQDFHEQVLPTKTLSVNAKA